MPSNEVQTLQWGFRVFILSLTLDFPETFDFYSRHVYQEYLYLLLLTLDSSFSSCQLRYPDITRDGYFPGAQ